jgi:hypothetical protein
MPDKNTAGDTGNNNNDVANVDDTTKTEKATDKGVDLQTLDDDTFSKVFDDPRLWKHPRFKGLNERAKLADKYEADLKTAEEKKLEEQKKYQELAEKRAKERDEAMTRYSTAVLENRILSEATKAGVIDTEAVLKLVDRSSIKVNDDGSVVGIKEALTQLLTDKPYLKGQGGQVKIGEGSSIGSGSTGSTPRFKLSQLQNATFYREHEKEIDQAFKAGTVENDLQR